MALINTTTTGVLGSTFYGDGTGSLTIQQNGVTLGIYGNIPIFSAYKSGSAQTISNSTYTKITFESEEFDTNNNFASSRFTPTVAGYYQINWLINIGSGSGSYEWVSSIFKNGVSYKTGLDAASIQYGIGGSALVYLNGTTDYIEIWSYQGSGGNKSIPAYQTGTWFEGILVKAA
jgi:hypothetical protein